MSFRGRLAFFFLLIVLFVLLYAGSAKAWNQERPVADIGMKNQTQLFLKAESDFDVIDSGSVLNVDIFVKDQHSVPVDGAYLTVMAFDSNGKVVKTYVLVTDAQGLSDFEFSATTQGKDKYVFRVTAEKKGCIPDTESFEVVVFAPSPPEPFVAKAETVSIGLGFLVVMACALTEFGRYGLFKTLIFPLYTRLKKEEVLDHFVRGQIYGFVMSHPGAHYNAIKQHLKVTNGTLSHHLRTLEMQGFLKSRRDGTLKRFYPIDVQVPRSEGIKLSDLQMGIIEMIKEKDGPTQGEISRKMGISQQSTSYNLRNLSREGILRFEKEGRLKRYYFAET